MGYFGAENVIIELSKKMKFFGYEPVIGIFNNLYNPHLELALEAKKNNIRVKIFPCRYKFDFHTIKIIKSFLKKNNVDILHTHGYKSNLYGLFGSTRKSVKVATNHMWIRSNLRSRIYCMLDSALIRFFDKIIAVSDPIKQDMLKKGIISDKIAVIYNGIDADRFNKIFDNEKLKTHFNIPIKSKVVGTVGSLIIEKGHTYFIEAANKVLKTYPDTRFLIVGDGRCRKELENKVYKLGLEKNIIFAGLRDDMPEMYSLMDVFVLPSLIEGMPMALLEAMASSKPVIASNVGSISKAVKNNNTGLLVSPGDVEDLAKTILFIISHEDAARTIGRNGLKKVRNTFLSEHMCKSYIAIYKKLLNQALAN
jgi:glycosyltransferase involved in cell wall biosynthesis